MNQLDKNWLTNRPIDFEYKKYVFLSYLTYVEKQFSDKKLFPVLTDLHSHYNDLREFMRSKKNLNNDFPKRAVRLDYKKISIEFENLINDSELLQELCAIADYGLSLLDRQVAYGIELLEFALDQISIEPVGISPINNNEGYLFFYYQNSRDVWIYKYTISLVKGLKDLDDQIKTNFVIKMETSLANSLEQIKKQLLKSNKDLPNPATFSIYAKSNIPYHETFLPVAKKALIDKLAA